MKKFFQCGIIVISIMCYCTSPINSFSAVTKNAHKPAEGSTEELYQDIYLTLLDPYIQKAVDDYYKQYFKDSPGVAPYMVDVVSIDRPNGYRTFEFIVKVQVMPYFGPHNEVGVDNITFKIGIGNEVRVEKFEHIKSIELPWNYQDEIINKWPPT
jgi:hypothetical protein